MSNKKEKRIQHYKSSQTILLVGEGDFSFSACLAKAFCSAHNMVATSLDSRSILLDKYGDCEEHLNELRNRGCLVLHEVDVNSMNRDFRLIGKKFDVIIFNFPHAGHFKLCETSNILIEMHKDLLKEFFGSARGMVNEGGEVHVAHRDDHPYNKWKLEEVALEKGFVLKEKVWFEKWHYPGYENKRGGSIKANGVFPLKDCFTFKFSLVDDGTISTSSEGEGSLLGDFCNLNLGNCW